MKTMEREILFRGLRADSGAWVYGCLIITDNDVLIAGADMYATKIDDCHYEFQVAKVIPESVGQFTGLTDKNGEEIFEGDKVKVSSYQFTQEYIVEFDPKIGVKPFHVPYDYDLVQPYYEDSQIEVIGNIHDNK